MPPLYDFTGRPIDKTRLHKEEAAPTITGVRQVLSQHPAQNLTPRQLSALLLAAEAGEATAYLELAEEMEEKDLHYRAVLSTRKLQVAGLPLTVDAASDAADDVKAADLVRDWLSTGILAQSLQDMLDAIGKGFSVCEIMWDTEGRQWLPKELIWRDPRWFQFDRLDGTTLYLKGEHGLPEPLAPAKFIVHTHKSKSGLPIRGGLARSVAWYYLFKNFDIKSWVQFAQVYGFPLRLGRYDASATQEDKQTLLRAVRSIAQDAAAIIPSTMQIDFQTADARGNVTVFEGLASYFDKQISKLVLGQTGTTDVGQHVGTANAHEKVRTDIETSDAAQLSATLNRDLVRPLVDLNLGARKRYPVLRIAREEAEDISSLVDNVVKLAAIAPDFVEVSVMRDKLGLPEPTQGAVTLGKPAQPEAVPPAPDSFPDSFQNKPKDNPKDTSKTRQSLQRVADSAPALPQDPDPLEAIIKEELGGWEPMISPLVDPILAHADACTSYDDFLAGLPTLIQAQDASTLAHSLALAMFEQRVKGGGHA